MHSLREMSGFWLMRCLPLQKILRVCNEIHEPGIRSAQDLENWTLPKTNNLWWQRQPKVPQQQLHLQHNKQVELQQVAKKRIGFRRKKKKQHSGTTIRVLDHPGY
eukprot:gene7176-475_t